MAIGGAPVGGYVAVAAPALRAVRVALYGGPAYLMTARETRLWIVSPGLVTLSRNRAATGYYFPQIQGLR